MLDLVNFVECYVAFCFKRGLDFVLARQLSYLRINLIFLKVHLFTVGLEYLLLLGGVQQTFFVIR